MRNRGDDRRAPNDVADQNQEHVGNVIENRFFAATDELKSINRAGDARPLIARFVRGFHSPRIRLLVDCLCGR